MLTHRTAWDQYMGHDETLKCGFKIEIFSGSVTFLWGLDMGGDLKRYTIFLGLDMEGDMKGQTDIQTWS